MNIFAHRMAGKSILAALALGVVIAAAPAWSQDNVTTVDCSKSSNTVDCIDKPQSAVAAAPTKTPIQAMAPTVAGAVPSDANGQGTKGPKPGHGN